MTMDAAASMTATQTPAPVKAWPNELRKWAYHPGSPMEVARIWLAMALPVRLNGSIHRIASKTQMAAHATMAPVAPKIPRPAAEESTPKRTWSGAGSALGQTMMPSRM
jgi:hypothetical protein